ncbi:efflux RND transporter permease subunit [Alteromonas pelagimontana]|uniref:Efflux RND transporter permease subunit n=1 Tax=Alteromonas pelagimontana TaxID=1858656 RepID=A0A6M4MAL5_9ALTE|nr:efflux RND transporter permease subunit [Alteromonas pelagimontana]QJR79848.1 efflux RND transporter permease subunit [Alteromonas pelagimontana]
MSKNNVQVNDLPSTAIRRPVLIVVLNLLIVIAGFAALEGLEVRELPDVDTPTITVTAELPGGSPETVDAEVTSRLEGAVARVSGVKDIYAQSEEGSARVRVEFRPGINLEDAANETRESVSRVQRQLPEDVEQVSIIRADNDAQAVVSLAISSDILDMESLTQRVDTDLAPLFLSIPGVADVTLSGDRERVLRVSVDPLRLTSYGLSMTDVGEALRLAPFDVPAGSIQSEDQSLIVRADATSVTAEDVASIVLSGNIRIGDVASVYFSPADSTSVVRLDGKAVIGLGIIRQASSNTIEISDEVLAMVKDLDKRFTDMDIVVTADDAEFIRDSVSEVVESLSLTILLVVFTLLVFIGSWRATLVPALSIPVSLAGALAIIWALGFSVNILTLLALVLATGMIVDDAIVVSENIQRRRGMGLGARAAAVIGTREVFFAVVATTAVLASVFIPIAFLPSTAGKLFREFGGVLAGAVIISSFVALSLVPALTARLPIKVDNGKESFFSKTFGRFGNFCLHLYQRSLLWSLKYAWLIVGLSILAGVGAWFTAQHIDNELLPSEDRGTIRIFARGPDGAGINFMDRQAFKMEELLMPYVENGTIDSIYTVVGNWDPNIVFITAPLKHWDDRDKSLQEIVDEIGPPLQNIPGAPGNAFGDNSLNLRGQGGGMELALTGDSYDNIYRAAQDFAVQIEDNIPELGAPRISYEPTQPQLRINIDRRRAEELGIPLNDIASTLRAAVNGDDITDLNVGDQAIPIMLQSSDRTTSDPSDLTNLYVKSNTGNLVPLSSVAYISEEGVAAELERQAQRRAIKLEMELPDDIAINEAVERIRALQGNLPDGIGLIFLGEAQTFEETSKQIALTYVLAFIIVLLVLAAQFESLNSAVVVMLTVPFGIAAAIYALFLTNTTINVYSQIGLVMLIGLLAKNAILLIEFADQLRDQGYSVYDAIVEAGKVRLRPIMMTLVSTILGGLPLILSTGAGAESRNAIGWVVFGGLGIAVIFTLYLTPVLYLGLARFSKPRADESQRLERELASADEQQTAI